MASVNLRGVGTQTLSLLLCYSTACDLDPTGSLQGPGRGVEEGPGCCHSPLTWIWSHGCSYLLGSLEAEDLLPGCQVQLKSRVCYLRRMRADFEDSQPSLPHVNSSGTLGSGNGLSCVFSISTPLAFLIELCLAFARQEGCVCQLCSSL